MSTSPQEPLKDEDIETTGQPAGDPGEPSGAAHGPADTTDADGADVTDAPAQDSDGTDGGDADTTDADGTDVTDAPAQDSDGTDA